MLGELWYMPPLPISKTTRTLEQFLCTFLPSHTSRKSLEPFLFKFLSLLPSPDPKTLIQELAVSEPSLVGHEHSRFSDSVCLPGTPSGHREAMQAGNQAAAVLLSSERGPECGFHCFVLSSAKLLALPTYLIVNFLGEGGARNFGLVN